MVGKSFGHYTVVAKLGHGGMGEVYLAHDLSLDRQVALKLLPETYRDDAESRRRILQEARAAAAIDHPYICKIFEVGEIEGLAFLAMEYLEGKTLESRLRVGPLPYSEALHIGCETLEGMIKAHEKGVVHGDLKPSNLMLLNEGHVKILDFGLARRTVFEGDAALTADTVTKGGSFVGTLAYMSPEQARSQTPDARSDIFSLGIVFYEMFAGSHPFLKPATMDTLFAILTEHPAPLTQKNPTCSHNLEQIVERMLAKAPKDRYQTFREVLDSLRRIAAGDSPIIPVRDAVPALSSIAVLPFVNMSADPEQEYFSDGITEDIIAELSRIPSFKVIARTSVMQYKNTTKDVAEIGRELRVENILQGSVRRHANRLRITAGLVEADTSHQRWTETFDRQMDDVFVIQTEVARSIAGVLSITLSPSRQSRSRRTPQDLDAYHLYLRGRYFMHKLVPDAVAKAIGFFRQALDKDPTYALSYAGLATCYATSGHFDFMPPREAFPMALSAAREAIKQDNTISEAHAARGLCQIFYEWDWPGAERSFRLAIDLDHNSAEALTYSSWGLCMVRRYEEAVAAARSAFDLDPLSSMAGTNLGWVLIMAGHFDEALSQLKHTLELDPDYTLARSIVGLGLLLTGQSERGLAELHRWSWRRTFVAIAHAMRGNTAAARTELQQILGPSQGLRYRPSEIALIHLALGERENAATWLERGAQERDYMLVLQAGPDWALGHDDPLVLEYFRRMGLPG